jgi:hypothetical protein
VLLLVDDHLAIAALVKFSGGLKNASGTKELNDIEKFYENMLKLLENIPESKQKRVFRARFYGRISLLLTLQCAHTNFSTNLDKHIYFEQLVQHKGS